MEVDDAATSSAGAEVEPDLTAEDGEPRRSHRRQNLKRPIARNLSNIVKVEDVEMSASQPKKEKEDGSSKSNPSSPLASTSKLAKIIQSLQYSPLKWKSYEIRRSGSEECLLGFAEEDGLAKLIKYDGKLCGISTETPYAVSKEKLSGSTIISPVDMLKQETEVNPAVEESPIKESILKESPVFKEPPIEKDSSIEESSEKEPPNQQSHNKSPQAAKSPVATAPPKKVVKQEDKLDHCESPKAHIVGDVDVEKQKKLVASSLHSATPIPKKPLSAKDDYYKKPFEYGWKRELVWRANLDASRDKADVYFITPSGKKLRNRCDIAPLLEGELTLDHFSFAREPLGVGPELETVRIAKPSSRATANAAKLAAASTTTTSIGKRISKPKGPKGASPPPQGWTPTRALKVNNAALLSSINSNRYGGASQSATVPTARKVSTSSGGGGGGGGGGGSSVRKAATKVKKRVNDIENDLKQINESIRNSRKPPAEPLESTSIQPHNAAANAIATVEHTNKMLASNFFSFCSLAYDALLYVLKYLKIHELPRAASVCKLWNLAAKNSSLWHTVRMKNSKVCNWVGFAAALRRCETKHLDLRKMLIANTRVDEMWQEFSMHIGSVSTLEIIDLCRCTARVVESLFNSNKNLRVLNAVAINDEAINLENIGSLENLEELRLRTCEPAILNGSLQPLEKLKQLTHLSITALRDLGAKDINVLQNFTQLLSLELGECGDFDNTFGVTVLPQLKKLQRLRLENGQETKCCALTILESCASLQELTQIELINFDIKPGFETALKKCNYLRKMLIIPTYISQSATTNNIMLRAVLQVADSLQVLTWGVTVELLRVTALYVNQCEESKKKEKHHFDECIPVLKPVPGAPLAVEDENTPSSSTASIALKRPDEATESDVPQIEILPLDKVEFILKENLPKTKFTIVKVPYHAAGKQQMVE